MAEGGAHDFTVDPGALQELAKTLVLLHASFSTAQAEIRGIDRSSFGDRRLTDAANHFVEHWEWGTKRIADALMDISGQLRQAATQYQQVEDEQLRQQQPQF